MKKLIFAEKRFIFRSGGEGGIEASQRSAEKVPENICKKADSRYFNIIKKAGTLKADSFQKRLNTSVLPKEVKKAAIAEVTKNKFLYPTKEAFDAKVAKVSKNLLQLIKKDNLNITPEAVNDLRAQAQGDIKRTAQKEAGYQENSSDDISVSTNALSQYKGIISQMNGKVSKAKLLTVAKNYKNIAVEGVDAAISRNTQGMVQSKINKHMTTALNA